MKVLLFNGSPHENGTTFTCLDKMSEVMEKEGIETEIVNVGDKAVRGCTGCGGCKETGKCKFDDFVNVCIEKIKDADGYVFGSPVYYAAPTGTIISFMDRIFCAARKEFAYKPGACIVVGRRAGFTNAYDDLNKYLAVAKMLEVPTTYWNMAIGRNGEEVLKDEEGIRTMENVAKNMAWLLKVLENAKKNGIEPPLK